jgi:hypothetical protein
VLAIVGQQSITVLADARTRPANDFFSVKVSGGTTPHPQGSSRGEKCERDFFYRTAAQASGETTVMHDFPLTDVDTMVKIAAAPRNNMRPQRRSRLAAQAKIAPARAVIGTDPGQRDPAMDTVTLHTASPMT